MPMCSVIILLITHKKWRYTALNSTHTVEIPYVLMSNGTLFEAQFTPEEIKLSQQTVKYMGNFLDTANPNIANKKKPSLPNIPVPNWPNLKESPSSSTLEWNLDLSVIKLPVPESCALFWDRLLVERAATKNMDKLSHMEKMINEAKAFEHSLLQKKNIHINFPKTTFIVLLEFFYELEYFFSVLYLLIVVLSSLSLVAYCL